MTTRLKLKPGTKGTKKLQAIYGDALLCVRYRYDAETQMRLKTVEIVVEKKPWTPPTPVFEAEELVPVRIAYKEKACMQMARKVGGTWDPEARLWFIPYSGIKGTELEKHIILDAVQKPKVGKKPLKL